MSDDIKKKIKNGDKLTFGDMMMAGFKPNVTTDEVTGRTVYPREEYLKRRAQERVEEEERKKREKGS